MFFRKSIFLAAISFAIVGCASDQQASQSFDIFKEKVVAKDLNNQDLYEVHHEGRIYFFDHFEDYQAFQQTWEAPYRLTRIGEGPKGETVVFGLNKKDKKKKAGIASVDMIDGKLKPAKSFYGEMIVEGRIYVFDSFEEMRVVSKVGEAAYRWTEIGSGPQGETVVYVLTKAKKKEKPVALIDAFRAKHNKA